MQSLNKRGHFVVGLIAGAIVALILNFFCTHHTVVEKDNCTWSIDASGYLCDFHYERNK